MLVLESLEKAEVEVADRGCLGEAAGPRARTHARVYSHLLPARSRAHTLRPARTLGVAVDTRSQFPACPRLAGPAGERLVKRAASGRVAPGPHRGACPRGGGFASFRCPVQSRDGSVPPGVRPVLAVLQKVWPSCSADGPQLQERVAFVSRALKWSSGGSGKLGHPRLHQLLALTLWKGRCVRVAAGARALHPPPPPAPSAPTALF